MINVRNFTLSEGEKGILLIFPSVPQSLPNKDIYIIEFKVSSVLPTLSPPIITFVPSNPTYTIIKNKNFAPTVNLNIKANHNFETQSLIQAIIKDQYNNVIHNDYLLVICSPVSEYSFRARLLINNSLESVGPNGGTILRMDDANAVNSLLPGMSVRGPGIPNDKNIYIKSFIQDRSTDIELSELIPAISIISTSQIYRFVRTINCANTEQLNNKISQINYITLNKDNNWCQIYDEQVVAKFVRSDIMDDSIEIYLPIKNYSVLIDKDSAVNIPVTTDIYGHGRVINSSVCLSSFS